jgi:hypothetical protein
MFGRNGGVKSKVTDAASAVRHAVAEYGDPLVKDEKLRRRLVAAVTMGAAARERAQRQMGIAGMARRLATDPVLRAQAAELAVQLRAVRRRVEKTQSHKLRNGLLFAAGAGMVVAAVPAARHALSSFLGGGEHEVPPPAANGENVAAVEPEGLGSA